jgi:RNA 2',3'-cyclic 3'-phosphodiesterase
MDASLSNRQGEQVARLFVAVELPDDVKRSIASVQRRFGGVSRLLKIPDEELLHITVRFVGAVEQTQIGAVKEAVMGGARQIEPFRLAIDGIGCFQRSGLPTVIWAGITEDGGMRALRELYAQCEERLVAAGLAPEARAFSAHITVARVRESANREDRQRVERVLSEVRRTLELRGTVAVRCITVMESLLSQAGPTYVPLLRIRLGEAGES